MAHSQVSCNHHRRSDIMADTDSTRSRWAPACQGDWLPLARREQMLTKPLTVKFIKAQKHYDWFLALAYEMNQQKNDPTQARMLAKLYLFCRDCLPRGLTASFAHIRGGDVMNYLLCHSGEHAMSRHKLTRDAEAALSDLEVWMQKGPDWKAAMQHWREDVDGEGFSKRKLGWKAMQQLSPAALLATLVIAHPDQRYKERIGRLQVQWMLQARESLDVQEGFWKGLNHGNFPTIFLPEEPRKTAVPFLADYNNLFAAKFQECRRDMRPSLPSWAKDLNVEEMPAVESDAESQIAPAPGLDALKQALSLRDCLSPETTREPAGLRTWLASQTRWRDDSSILYLWSKHWAARIGSGTNYKEQVILQSLFFQSIHRLERLCSSVSDEMAGAYMRLDMEDAGWSPLDKSDTEVKDIVGRLNKIPRFQAFMEVHTRLSVVFGGSGTSALAKDAMKKILDRQAVAFFSILTQPHHQSACDIKDSKRLRTEVILQDAAGAKPDTDASRQETLKTLKNLLDEGIAASLHLTLWQLRILLVPSVETQSALTSWQSYFYQQQFCAHESQSIDMSKHKPVASPHLVDKESNDLGHDQLDAGRREMLTSLFADLREQSSDTTEPDVVETSPEFSPLTPSQPAPPTSSTFLQKPPRTVLQQPPRTQRLPAQDDSQAAVIQPAPTKEKAPPATPQRSISDTNGLNGQSPVLFDKLFAGKKHNPEKRKLSELDKRKSKMPKLSNLTRDDIVADLTACKAELEAGLRAEIDGLKEVLLETQRKEAELTKREISKAQHQVVTMAASQAELQAMQTTLAGEVEVVKSTTEELHAGREAASRESRDELVAMQEKLERKVRASEETVVGQVTLIQEMAQTEAHAHSQELRVAQESITQAQVDYTALRDQIRADGEALKEEARSARQASAETAAALKTEVLSAVQGLGESLARAPLLGQQGYFAQSCVAPPESGWTQETYESLLLFAGWHYIALLGSPIDGVSADEKVVDAVIAKFSGLPQKHFLRAIEHAHMQAYRCPFNPEN